MVGDGLLVSQQSSDSREPFYGISENALQTERYQQLFPPNDAIVTETGEPLVTEDGNFIVAESRPEEPIAVDSASWTGRTLSTSDTAELVQNIDQALSKIDAINLTQEKRAQARAFLRAVRELAEAPEPPFDLIEYMLKNVDRMIGLAGLFVGIAGFMVAL